jgi:hypothetical protein
MDGENEKPNDKSEPGPVIAPKRKRRAATKCRNCKSWEEYKKRIRIAESLQAVIAKIKEKIESKDFKPTLAEYLKLLDAQQVYELQDAENGGPKEIRVTWVEPPNTLDEK